MLPFQRLPLLLEAPFVVNALQGVAAAGLLPLVSLLGRVTFQGLVVLVYAVLLVNLDAATIAVGHRRSEPIDQ